MSNFKKYQKSGGYHWEAVSRSLRHHHCFTAARYRLVLEMAHAGPGTRVVDVGSGDGVLTWLLAGRGARCIGIEPNEMGRTLAAKEFARRGADIELADDLAEVPAGSQDVVVCAEVIEHVPEPLSLLRACRRVLKPGGRLIMTTPIRLTEEPLDAEHFQEFFPDEFAELIRRGGFDVVEHRQEFPAFAVGLYYWRPAFLGGLPIAKAVMNMHSAWFGGMPMRRVNGSNRFPMHQIIHATPVAHAGDTA